LSNNLTPQRGEVWLVNFDPTIGTEIRKTRPAVIVSSNAVGKLPIKLVAPITDWKDYFAQNLWHIRLAPDTTNNLTKVSAVDVLQLRGIDTQRLIRKLGNLSETKMLEITIAIAARDEVLKQVKRSCCVECAIGWIGEAGAIVLLFDCFRDNTNNSIKHRYGHRRHLTSTASPHRPRSLESR
jgi:mRNA interferase MazF